MSIDPGTFLNPEIYGSELNPGNIPMGPGNQRANLATELFNSDGRIDSEVFDTEVEETRGKSRDLWVWGCMGLVSVADVVKTICSQTSDHGGNVSNLVGNVGQLELAVAAALGIYQTMKGTNSAWTMWALALSAAAGAVAGCESLGDFGFGSPDRGTGFNAGATSLGFVVSELDGADPQDSLWSGDAADQYKARNKDQKDLLNRLADLDRAMVAIVQRQAEQAEQVRQGMAGTKTVLATGAAVCAGIAAFAAADPTGAANVALGKLVMLVGALPMITCMGLGITGIVHGAQNRTEAKTLQGGYDGVAKDAASRATAGPPPPIPAPAPAAPVAPVTPPAPVPPAAPVGPASPAAPAAGPAPAADPAPAPSANPTPAAGVSSTVEQLAQAMGLGMQMEPALAQAATQGMQSMQQFAQMAAQAGSSGRHAREPGGPTAPPAPPEPDLDGAPAGGPEPAAAASGAPTGAGRAPLDTTAPGPTPAADPAERAL